MDRSGQGKRFYDEKQELCATYEDHGTILLVAEVERVDAIVCAEKNVLICKGGAACVKAKQSDTYRTATDAVENYIPWRRGCPQFLSPVTILSMIIYEPQTPQHQKGRCKELRHVALSRQAADDWMSLAIRMPQAVLVVSVQTSDLPPMHRSAPHKIRLSPSERSQYAAITAHIGWAENKSLL